MDDVKGDAVPARTVFAVFVRPPRSKDNDVAATKAFESDPISLCLAAPPLCDDDCLSYFLDHDVTPSANASSDHLEECPANDLAEYSQGIARGRATTR